jgi:hypothetical protein
MVGPPSDDPGTSSPRPHGTDLRLSLGVFLSRVEKVELQVETGLSSLGRLVAPALDSRSVSFTYPRQSFHLASSGR